MDPDGEERSVQRLVCHCQILVVWRSSRDAEHLMHLYYTQVILIGTLGHTHAASFECVSGRMWKHEINLL